MRHGAVTQTTGILENTAMMTSLMRCTRYALDLLQSSLPWILQTYGKDYLHPVACRYSAVLINPDAIHLYSTVDSQDLC